MKLTLKISLWLLAFVPLIMDNSVFFPFIFGKTLFIRIFIFLASALFFGHFVSRPDFRNEVYTRFKKAVKNPLAVSLTLFMTVVLISTIFSIFPFRAFFGDVERGEGFLGLLAFFAFFVYSYLSFDYKDWMLFFKLNILSGIILFVKAIVEFSSGIARPGAFTGNPEFLAGYFLFTTFCSLIILKGTNKNDLWRYIAPLTGLMSVAGVFLTQTRGTILGLAAGIVALVIYGLVFGNKAKFWGKLSVRNVSVIATIVMIILGGAFLATKDAAVWQKVPGLSRIAQLNGSDASSRTRLISWGVSRKAIAGSNAERFLIGYGQDDFNIAYNQNYDPRYYQYEHTWFDRAHNKLLDMWVMHGTIGLLAYLAIWASIFWLVFRRKQFSFEMMAVFLFGAAYFTHLLTVFDQISTYIPFFALLAFIVYFYSIYQTQDPKQSNLTKQKLVKKDEVNVKENLSFVGFGLISIFFLWILIAWTIIPMGQMSDYLTLVQAGDSAVLAQNIDSVFTPYTYVQQDIRLHFLSMMVQYYGKGNKQTDELFLKAVDKMEELVNREPYNARFLVQLATAYDYKSRMTKNPDDIKNAEKYYKEAMSLAPNRQDIIYGYSMNLINQGRNDEAIAMLRQSVSLVDTVPETHYYLGVALYSKGETYYLDALKETEKAFDMGLIAQPGYQTVYGKIGEYFYARHDKNGLLLIMKRIGQLSPDKKADSDKVISEINAGGWPTINFQ